MTTYRCPHCGIEFQSSYRLRYPRLSVWLVGFVCRFWYRGPKGFWLDREHR
jgi:hypothetical protein